MRAPGRWLCVALVVLTGCAQAGRPVPPEGRRLCCGESPTAFTVDHEPGTREEAICVGKAVATPPVTLLLGTGVTLWAVFLLPFVAAFGRLDKSYWTTCGDLYRELSPWRHAGECHPDAEGRSQTEALDRNS